MAIYKIRFYKGFDKVMEVEIESAQEPSAPAIGLFAVTENIEYTHYMYTKNPTTLVVEPKRETNEILH